MTEFFRIFSYFVRSCWKNIMVEVGMWMVVICIYFLLQVVLNINGPTARAISPGAGLLTGGVFFGTLMTFIGWSKNYSETSIGFFRPLSAMIAYFIALIMVNVTGSDIYDKNVTNDVAVFGAMTLILCAAVFIYTIFATFVNMVHLAHKWVDEESHVGEDHM